MGASDGQSLSRVERVVVLGGTHGNERTGVHVAQYLRRHPDEFVQTGLRQVEAIFANPRAIGRNVRYVDRDLNRCFFYDYASPLGDTQLKGRVAGMREYEMARALSLRAELGALAEPLPFLIDLHTTTANMGTSLIVSDEDPWMLALCRGVAEKMADVRFVSDKASQAFQGTAGSLARHSLTIEIGPIAQGTLDPRAFEHMLQTLKVVLGMVAELNKNASPKSSGELPPNWHRWLEYTLDYPRDAEQIPIAFLHPEFAGSDYQPLGLETKVFLTPEGEATKLKDVVGVPAGLLERLARGEPTCATFIGESAYVEKGLAFLTAEKV